MAKNRWWCSCLVLLVISRAVLMSSARSLDRRENNPRRGLHQSDTIETSTLNCVDAPETGLCRAYFEKWYFDSSTSTCKTFVYGGCGGNTNRFETESDCLARCGGTSASSPVATNKSPSIDLPCPNTAPAALCFVEPCALKEAAVDCPGFADAVCYNNLCTGPTTFGTLSITGTCSAAFGDDLGNPVSCKAPVSACQCQTTLEPVCAADGLTYANLCVAECADAVVLYEAACSEGDVGALSAYAGPAPAPGPSSSSFPSAAPDPGPALAPLSEDAPAPAPDVKSTKSPAPVGGDGSSGCFCTLLFSPVCTQTGAFYGNACQAACAGETTTFPCDSSNRSPTP